MPTTAKGLRYPSGTDAPDIAADLAELASDVDALIGNTPLMTKGDLLAYSTAETRLAVSATNGDALIADSTQATGLRWGNPDLAGGWELIGTVITQGANTVEFTGISGYQTLRVHMRYSDTGLNTNEQCNIMANNVTASTSVNAILRTLGPTFSPSKATGRESFAWVISNGVTWCHAWIEFAGADLNVLPNSRSVHYSCNPAASATQEFAICAGRQADAGAITSLKFVARLDLLTQTWVDGTRITLYGLKAFGV